MQKVLIRKTKANFIKRNTSDMIWYMLFVCFSLIGLVSKILPDYPFGILTTLISSFILFKLFALVTIGKAKWISTPLDGILLLFLLFGIFQMFNPSNAAPIIGLQGFRAFFFPLMFYFVGTNLIRSKWQVYKIFKYILYFGVFIGLFGIIQVLLPNIGIAQIIPIGNNYGYYLIGGFYKEKVVLVGGLSLFRITSTLTTFSSFGFFISVFLIASFGFYILTHKKCFVIMSAVGMIAVFLTFTRTVYVASFIGILLLYYYGRKCRLISRKILIGPFLILIILFLILPYNVRNLVIHERILSILSGVFSGQGSANSWLMTRFSTYKIYLEKFGSALLIGNGLGTTVGISEKYSALLKFGIVIADNDFLNVLYQTGIFGLLLFVIIFQKLFYYGYKMVKRSDHKVLFDLPIIIYAILIILFLMSLTFDPLVEVPSNFLFWLLAGILLSYNHKREIEGEEFL